MKKLPILGSMIILFACCLYAQVTIKEKISIQSNTQSSQSLTPSTITSTWDIPPSTGYTYFRFTMGGRVTLRPTFYSWSCLTPNIRITALPIGNVVFQGNVLEGGFFGKEHEAGSFLPGDNLSLSVEFLSENGNYINSESEASGTYGTLGLKSEWGYYSVRFRESSNKFSFSLRLYSDISTAVDLRSDAGPPKQERPFVAPLSGALVARYLPNSYSGDRLLFRSKNDSLLMDAALQNFPVNLGEIVPGDTFRLPMISGAPSLLGQQTYPRYEWDSRWLMWYIEYEDWIDADFLDAAVYAWIAPPAYTVRFEKNEVTYGDTIRMFIDPVSGTEDAEEPMDIRIIEGRGIAVIQDTLGNSYGTDLWGRPFRQVRNELRLVVASGGGSLDSTARIIVQIVDDWDWNKTGRGVLVKGNKENEILLGETKYYYTVLRGDKLEIEETSNPILPAEGISSEGVWSNSAVQKVEGDEKLGVYWEKKKPEGAGLPNGLIRLVGRYWEKDKTFRVKLTAIYQNLTTSISIKVTKPTRLLTPGQNPTYQLSRDVFNNEIDIDSICISYGGKYGVPPHFIKGQMEQEADHHGNRFNPSYRYEPYTVQFWPGVIAMVTNPFFVRESPVNDPPIPQHQNVRTIEYPYPNKTVWDMVYDHSQLVNDINDESHRLYGIRNTDGSMNFSPYSTLTNKYREYLNEFLETYNSSIAISKANERIVVFLRDKWKGGLKNVKAQTRIASSYGLLQMLYTTALARRYPSDRQHLPEELNVTTAIMELSLKYQKSLLERYLGYALEETGDWPAGFETSFRFIVYYKWNPNEWYRNGVMRKVLHYLPQNQ
ncbi:MAG: hypothetical protein V1799_01020 [bacterium]